MALKSTIYKADLQVADMDRHYYGTHALTIARHPSETDERMMMRLLAYALHADEALRFGKGLSADEEPDLWQKDLTGAVERWIEVGQPDDRRMLKASRQAGAVFVYSYGGSANWWNQMADRVARIGNLAVFDLPAASSRALAALARRSMQVQCTIQDGQVWMHAGDESVAMELTVLKEMPRR